VCRSHITTDVEDRGWRRKAAKQGENGSLFVCLNGTNSDLYTSNT